MEFHKPANIDFSKLSFSKKKPSPNSKFNIIKAFYNKKYLGLKLPALKIPFNSAINKFNQLEINISLGKNQDLIDKINDLDEQIQEFSKTLKWFDGIENEQRYVSTLKQSLNTDFPPYIKLKVYEKDGVVNGTYFDENKKQINVESRQQVADLMKKNTWVQTALECSGVWFANNSYGLAWKAEQIRIKTRPQEEQEDGYAFWSDNSSENTSTDIELLIDDE